MPSLEWTPQQGCPPDTSDSRLHKNRRSASESPVIPSNRGIGAFGYSLTSISCDDADSTGSPVDGNADFRVGGGEHGMCTLTSTKQP
jgi:hypothetical protein